MNKTPFLFASLLFFSAVEVSAQADPPSARSLEVEATQARSLLVRVEGASPNLSILKSSTVNGYRLQPLFDAEPYVTKGTEHPVGWFLAVPEQPMMKSQGNPWDDAHAFLKNNEKLAPFISARAVYVEPNVKNMPYPAEAKKASTCPSKKLSAPEVQVCDDQRSAWVNGDSFAWHLGKQFTQLSEARKNKTLTCVPYITILDTGIRASHFTAPRHLEKGKNFVEGGNNAEDPGPHFGDKNSGHGTATVAILAGKHVRVASPKYQFDDDLGGAPDAKIVPVRIANSVVHFYTDAMARGIQYAGRLARDGGKESCHVVSISMGGLASRAWADAVNYAYDHGVTIVAASGNNFKNLPTRYTVYPSRFARVITATGATASHEPYRHEDWQEMEGSWGPPSVMKKALGAYTPNTTWADYRHDDVVNMDGAGTSSATPQIAAAAALWLGKFGGEYPANWKRVAAVRNALFEAAEKKLPTPAINKEFYGRGLLRAADAMTMNPGVKPSDQSPRAEVSFPFWRILLGLNEPKFAAKTVNDEELRMYEVESLSLTMQSDDMSHLTGDIEDDLPSSTSDDGKRLLQYLCKNQNSSARLQDFLKERKACSA